MSPTGFLRDPIEWLRTISNTRGTHSGGPNFAYDLCTRRVGAADLEQLDLSSWTHAYNGAEPIRPDTLERFAKTFEPCGFRPEAFLPCYGLAEATLLVTGGPTGQGATQFHADAAALAKQRVQPPGATGKRRAFVGCGELNEDAHVLIVHPETRRECEGDQIGEIWVRGSGVGRGYWNRPEESEAVFAASLEPSGERFLRTGDLGFIAGGQLYVTGRLKDLIIIRGQNYYPQDVESTVAAASPAVRQGCCIAVGLSDGEQEGLGVFFEVDQRAQETVALADVVRSVWEAISENHGLAPVVVGVVKNGELPKTSSGKLRRSSCREGLLSGTLPLELLRDDRKPAAAETPADDGHAAGADDAKQAAALEQCLLTEVRRITGAEVGPDAVITRLGINSVAAIDIMFAVEQEFGLTIAPEHFTENVTVGELAKRILSGSDAGPAQEKRAASGNGEDTKPQRLPMQLSLMYFSTDTLATDVRYDLFLKSARFADEHGFHALWIPERHFHAFGGTYPNPSVAAAALAVITRTVRLRAGSVVMPLHHPVRVAEEWSFVDNLSNGRVDIAFAPGWSPNDFVLAPERFERRREITMEGIDTVRRLWSGESLTLSNGRGDETPTKIHPRPVQAMFGTWLTCASSAESFVEAGASGYNVLTALLFQSHDELAEKIALYRKARAEHGHRPEEGTVTLMLHSFLGKSREHVYSVIAEPFKRYLASSVYLWQHEWPELLADGKLSKELLELAFERYKRNSLFGSVSDGASIMARLGSAGVNEVACLIDFGVQAEEVLASLQYLNELKSLVAGRQEPVREPARNGGLGRHQEEGGVL
jgi:natural product biosynthesis luciferase-like monooxygenase protein